MFLLEDKSIIVKNTKVNVYTLEKQKNIFMKYYKHDKIDFNAEFNYVKNDIKSLLLCLKNIIWDVKPDNFIYIDKNNYLIDFDFSTKIGSENHEKCSYTFNAPEKNNYTTLYDKASGKIDIWSVGIILLLLYKK